jgi:hypothetical protein
MCVQCTKQNLQNENKYSIYFYYKSTGLTDDADISKQSAIFLYKSLTLLKPVIRPVGLPCAS